MNESVIKFGIFFAAIVTICAVSDICRTRNVAKLVDVDIAEAHARQAEALNETEKLYVRKAEALAATKA